MFPSTIDKEISRRVNNAYLFENSASAAEVTTELFPPSWSGIHEVIFDIDSFLDDYSFERNLTKSLMLTSEKVLRDIWDSPGEDEAWQHL